MRRFPAIILFAAFILPTLTPLLALSRDPDANLPACCRRHDKNHMCPMMMAYLQNLQKGVHLQSIPRPCYPASQAATFASVQYGFLPDASAQFFAAVVSHPAIHAQTEARARVSLFCARQKRGPPSLLI